VWRWKLGCNRPPPLHVARMDDCPPFANRQLTPAEIALARSVFGAAIDYESVRIHRKSWWIFQPRNVCMAPRGALHFHAQSEGYLPCFAQGSLADQAFFIHEMAHVWQHQSGMNLLLRRHPFSRYRYSLKPGKKLRDYGVEQQAEIIAHAFLARRGVKPDSAAPAAQLEALLPF